MPDDPTIRAVLNRDSPDLICSSPKDDLLPVRRPTGPDRVHWIGGQPPQFTAFDGQKPDMTPAVTKQSERQAFSIRRQSEIAEAGLVKSQLLGVVPG